MKNITGRQLRTERTVTRQLHQILMIKGINNNLPMTRISLIFEYSKKDKQWQRNLLFKHVTVRVKQ